MDWSAWPFSGNCFMKEPLDSHIRLKRFRVTVQIERPFVWGWGVVGGAQWEYALVTCMKE